MLLASDEAYSELWFGDAPPSSALATGDLSNVVVLQTLSKRSSMTGYRSGFAAGDPDLIGELQRLRPAVGVTPQEFVQRASIAARGHERHVEDNRARYAAKRAIFLAAGHVHAVPSEQVEEDRTFGRVPRPVVLDVALVAPGGDAGALDELLRRDPDGRAQSLQRAPMRSGSPAAKPLRYPVIDERLLNVCRTTTLLRSPVASALEGGASPNQSSLYASSEASSTSWERQRSAASRRNDSGATAPVGLFG